jgi:hypothetical protein
MESLSIKNRFINTAAAAAPSLLKTVFIALNYDLNGQMKNISKDYKKNEC